MRSIRNAVVYSLFLISAHAGAATATPGLLLEVPIQSSATEVTSQFEVNRELGRAWIRIDVWDGGSEFPTIVKTERKAVEGLFYDLSTQRVIHRTGADTIVCAEDSKFLWTERLIPTGNCSIRVSTEERIADDGFETAKQRIARVFLVPEPHS